MSTGEGIPFVPIAVKTNSSSATMAQKLKQIAIKLQQNKPYTESCTDSAGHPEIAKAPFMARPTGSNGTGIFKPTTVFRGCSNVIDGGVEACVHVPPIKDNKRKLLLEPGVLATNNGAIKIDLTEAGFGNPTLDLGDGYGFSSRVKYEILQTNNCSLQFGLQFKRREFDRSNNKTISNGSTVITISEPDSTTMQTTLSASYRHHF